MLRPVYFFGKVGTGARVEIWEEEGRIYPHPTGQVSHELEDACNRLRGESKTFIEAFQCLKAHL